MLGQWAHKHGRDYSSFIWDAVTDPTVFASFRRDPRYMAVVETLRPETGKMYLDHIRDVEIQKICLASDFADTIGAPATFAYEGAQLAPTTLRYGKILSDIVALFDFTAIEEIVEIGVGHGGQARILAEYAKQVGAALRVYTCVDLLPVLLLARQYLEHFTLSPQFCFLSKLELPRSTRWGLGISNYAFSELEETLQGEYIERILRRCDGGYLTMNSGLWRDEWQGQKCFTVERLLEVLPNAALLFDEPLTARDNYVIIFGRHRANEGGITLDAIRARSRAAEPPQKKVTRQGVWSKLLGRKAAHDLAHVRAKCSHGRGP